jgi:Bacterial lectin
MPSFPSPALRPPLVHIAAIIILHLLGQETTTSHALSLADSTIKTFVNYTTGFNCNLISTGVLTVNDGGRAFPRLTPLAGAGSSSSSSSSSLCYLEMTTDTAISRGSTAFFPITFLDGTYNFVVQFSYRIYGPGAAIGDGLTWLIHQDNRGVQAQGGSGGFLGVYGPNIIQNALVVELDTCE